MKRRPRSRKERARLFELHGGICHLCSGKIGPGEAWELEHVVAFGLSHDDSDGNVKPAHRKCHRAPGGKTADDVARIAKAKRQADKFSGVVKPKGFPRRPTRTNPETGQREIFTGFRWKEMT